MITEKGANLEFRAWIHERFTRVLILRGNWASYSNNIIKCIYKRYILIYYIFIYSVTYSFISQNLWANIFALDKIFRITFVNSGPELYADCLLCCDLCLKQLPGSCQITLFSKVCKKSVKTSVKDYFQTVQTVWSSTPCKIFNIFRSIEAFYTKTLFDIKDIWWGFTLIHVIEAISSEDFWNIL